MTLHRLALLTGLLLFVAGPLLAADWGTIKGQVVWEPADLPARKPINVGNNPACLKNGPLLEAKFVVDKDTRGVRWVMVWLADAKQPRNPKAEIPIHPDLKEIKDKTVAIDQPCCVYEPHVFGLRFGQTLVCKNSGTIPHNVKIDGGADNPNINVLIPPGTKTDVEGWNPTGSKGGVRIGCSIHPWMECWTRVFKHPYFAVTNEKDEFEIKNAPAGEFRLIVWHPEGWVLAGRGEGRPITIKAQGVTDVGQVKYNPQ